MSELADIAAALGENTDTETAPVKVQPIGLGKTVKIILEESDDIPPTGLYIGLNGYGYMIRPGEEVNVPLGVQEILDHAIETVAKINPQTRQVIGYRQKHRFPYRICSEHKAA